MKKFDLISMLTIIIVRGIFSLIEIMSKENEFNDGISSDKMTKDRVSKRKNLGELSPAFRMNKN